MFSQASYKSAPLEFRSIHNTLQSTKFTPLQCHLLKFCICPELKLSEKSNFETPEAVPTKARVPSEICNYG